MHCVNMRTFKWIRNIITLLIACCISFTLQAQEIQLTNNHPERHVVVKGDTLWGISAKFLKDPWRWPEVWKNNRASIANPHLIYPGDVVVLQMIDGMPSLQLLSESYLKNPARNDANSITLSPEVLIEPLEKSAIPTIPLGKIAPFLNQPLVVENDDLTTAPRIVAGPDNRVILSPGTRVYVRNLADKAPLDWHVYRQGEALVDPETKTDLGHEAIYLGDASLSNYGDPATATITKAKEEILVRDRLSPVQSNHAIHFMPQAPEHAVKGQIIRLYGGLGEAGPNSIVTINRGNKNGIKVGHVLAIQRKGRMIKDKELIYAKSSMKEKLLRHFKSDDDDQTRVELPDERIGLMMVFRVFDHVAYGLVMQASDPINPLDTVANP